MKHFFYFLAVAFAVSSCSQPFKKAKDGTQYKIIKAKNGKKIAPGNYMELYVVVKYRDSLLMSSFEDGMPQYAAYDTTQFPPLFKELFKDVSIGDSLVLKFSTDSLINKQQAAPFMKKGYFILQSFKIHNAYATKQQSDSAAKTHLAVARTRAFKKATDQLKKDLSTTLAPQMKIDEKILTDYMNKMGTKANKAEWGTFVAISNPGTGETLNEKSVALVNYTGKSLTDSVFDSNVDPKFGHVEPYSVDMTQFNVMPGWIDGLKMLKKGSKATFLIPSSLGYGKNGRQPAIKPNENLVFDIEVVDVITPEQHEAMQLAKQQEQMAMQQKMQEEAMKNAQKKATPEGKK